MFFLGKSSTRPFLRDHRHGSRKASTVEPGYKDDDCVRGGSVSPITCVLSGPGFVGIRHESGRFRGMMETMAKSRPIDEEAVAPVTWEDGQLVPLTPERQARMLLESAQTYEAANLNAPPMTRYGLPSKRPPLGHLSNLRTFLAIAGLLVGLLFICLAFPNVLPIVAPVLGILGFLSWHALRRLVEDGVEE